MAIHDKLYIMKQQKTKLQYRYYEVPPDTHILALLGKGWIREYDNNQEILHFHNCLEIGYCHSGIGTMTYGDSFHPYGDRMMTIVPAQYPHNTNSKPGNKCRWEYLFVSLDSVLASLVPNNTFARAQLARKINKEARLLRHDDNPQIANLILSIMDEHRTKDSLFQESVSGMLQSLVVCFARLHGDDLSDTNSGKEVSAISAAIDYVDKNYGEKLSVSMLADTCHMSETHFRRVFLQSMNISPLAYINRIRIEAACRLLHTTNESIGDIAIKSGFTTITALNRNFKEIVGMTPTEWRKDSNYYERKLMSDSKLLYEGWK